MNLVLIAVLVGNLTLTSYRSVRNQTDSTPFHTSTGEKVRPGGCAISRNLLCGACRKLHHRCRHPEYPKKLHYGDWLYTERYGFRQINDVMGERQHHSVRTRDGRKVLFKTIRNAVDIWVATYEEEKSVDVQQSQIWKIYPTTKEN